MSNAIFGAPIYSDVSVLYTPTLSGGSWSASLPLTNLQDRRLAKVARSSSATTTATTFDVDLGVARAVGVLAILVPNLTKSAVPTVRWIGSSTSTFASSVYDSTAVAAWPSGIDAEESQGLNVWTVTLPPSAQTARYWRCALADSANVDGYLNVARVVIAAAYQPAVNMSRGATLGLQSDTTRTVTDGGAAIYNAKSLRREVSGVLDEMQEAEAFDSFWRMSKQLGTHGQLFFVYDPADTARMHDRAFLACFKVPSALEDPYIGRYRAPFSLVEEL